MKRTIVALALAALSGAAFAAAPAVEQQFIDGYKKSYEAKNVKALEALLYTKDANPQALEFYKMMLGAESGGKITSITLVPVTDEDKKKMATDKGPDGKPMRFAVAPYKKLVVKSETKDKNGSSSSTSTTIVGEVDGKLWILVPAK